MCHWIILKLCPLWCILTLCPVIITNQKWLKICLRNDLYCVQWGIKTHAHSLMVKNYWKIKYCQPSLWFASVSCKQQVVWWQATSGLVQSADGTAWKPTAAKCWNHHSLVLVTTMPPSANCQQLCREFRSLHNHLLTYAKCLLTCIKQH